MSIAEPVWAVLGLYHEVDRHVVGPLYRLVAITTTVEGPANEAGMPTAPRTASLASDTRTASRADDDVYGAMVSVP